jgi:DNA-directed RNA polymerase beta subunit
MEVWALERFGVAQRLGEMELLALEGFGVSSYFIF